MFLGFKIKHCLKSSIGYTLDWKFDVILFVPRSPDITPCDLFLVGGGHVKECSTITFMKYKDIHN